MNNRITSLIIIFFLMMFSACAHVATSPDNTEALRQKVEAEWTAKVEKDWGTVYDMLVEEYKNLIDRNTFIQRANIHIQEFSVEEVKIVEPGKEASAVVKNTIFQMGFEFKKTSKEKWIWENGDWHLYLPPATALGPFAAPAAKK
ncbi:MAG: hypothetical protein GY749_32205 [Desulfobacteraceae bacterium]|nr:hypothetical protein [Desulfobacteraceae bacterium]